MQADSTHNTQRATRCPRRRARAMPSMVATRTGTISASTSSRTAQIGISLPCHRRYDDGAGTVRAGLERADGLKDRAPERADLALVVGSSAAGTRDPDAEMSTAGSPLSANGRCSEAASGNARCRNWPPMLSVAGGQPGLLLRPPARPWSAAAAAPPASSPTREQRAASARRCRPCRRARSPRRRAAAGSERAPPRRPRRSRRWSTRARPSAAASARTAPGRARAGSRCPTDPRGRQRASSRGGRRSRSTRA